MTGRANETHLIRMHNGMPFAACGASSRRVGIVAVTWKDRGQVTCDKCRALVMDREAREAAWKARAVLLAGGLQRWEEATKEQRAAWYEATRKGA